MAEREEHSAQQATSVAPPPGTVADLFREALPDVELIPYQTAWDVALIVRREDMPRVMQAAKEDPRLAFDFLRSISGVDTFQELEGVYHLYSFRHRHTVQIKTTCPYDDPRVPSMAHLWQTANWHEREAAELFGILFDGHPDLRPLLTEEELGYFPLRKSSPLAEIEESQEDYVRRIMAARAPPPAAAAAPTEAPAPVDERAAKIALAQKKAAVIKKAREEARAKGLSGAEEKAYVQAALKALEAEEAPPAAPAPSPAAAPTAAPAAKPPLDRAAKIALAQKKAAVIKKAREEARARGMSGEEERRFVAEALKRLSAEQGEE